MGEHLRRLNQSIRYRELAGTGRSGRFSRSRAWERQKRFALSSWPVTVGLVVLTPLLMLPAALLQHGTVRAAMIGASIATGIWIAVLLVTIASGAGTQIMATVAEGWTASDLRRQRRSGWRLVNGLKLRDIADIDHLAVGPAGVLSVETKWSGEAWPLDGTAEQFMEQRQAAAVNQAHANATDVRNHFRRDLGDAIVRPILVLWSPASEGESSDWAQDGDVTLVQGTALNRWLTSLDERPLQHDEIERIWAAFDHRVIERDNWEETVGRPSPKPTLLGALWRWVLQPYLGAVVAAYALGAVAQTNDWRFQAIGTVIAVVLGLVALLRVEWLRPVATGWLCVCTTLVVVVGVTVTI